MKNVELFSPKIERLFRQVVAFQLAVMVLSVLTMDFGDTAKINAAALAAFWCGAALILIWRRHNLTNFDLAYFKWGFPLLVLLLNPLIWCIWSYRGLS